MAFAMSNVKVASMGNLKHVVGQWTGAEGDASGEYALKGGICYDARFHNYDATSQEDRPVPVSVTESGGTITVTVHNHVNVTTGRFIITYA